MSDDSDHPTAAHVAPTAVAAEAVVPPVRNGQGAAAAHSEMKEGGQHETSPNGQRYVKLDVLLGSGAYKDVWRAYDTREGIEVAWNVIKLKRIPVNDRKRVKNEVLLLKEIEHKNIIKYHSSWIDREKQCVIFITEIMSSGSLKEYLRKNPMVRWKAVKRWCIQILDGLSFLHSKHIIHRDIKCDNIFINGSTGDIRIGDLGLSTRIGLRDGMTVQNTSNVGSSNSMASSADEDERENVTAETMTCLGTPEFMAPELYDETYDVKVDIYAFGMACLEMVTALTPYHLCTSAAQIYKKVSKGELPPELGMVYSRNSKAFITACLQPHNLRPSAAQLLLHDFLKENESEDFKFVRGKLGSGLEELREEDHEDPVPEEVVTKESKEVGDAKFPNGGSLSAGSLSQIKARHVSGSKVNDEAAVHVGDTQDARKSSLEPSGNKFGELGHATKPEDSYNKQAASVPLYLDNSNEVIPGSSHGSSGDGSGVRSRILRVKTRAGSLSGGEPLWSNGPDHVANATDEASLQPHLTGKSQLDLSELPGKVVESNQKVSEAMGLPDPVVPPVTSDQELDAAWNETEDAVLPKRFLSSATIFDLLDIKPGESRSDEGDSIEIKVDRCNSALIIMMAVPSCTAESYQEVEFEYDFLTDDPIVVVEEMQSDPELANTIEPFATNIIASLSAVCDIAKRVALERISSSNFTPKLSLSVLRELISVRCSDGEDLQSYAQYVDCSKTNTAADPLALLRSVAYARLNESGFQKGYTDSTDNIWLDVSDAEIDRMLLDDLKYHELLKIRDESLVRANKEYDRIKISLNSQKEKVEEKFKVESEKCIARKFDLNSQLEDMQLKLKDRMLDFSKLKEQVTSRQKERKIARRLERESNLSTLASSGQSQAEVSSTILDV